MTDRHSRKDPHAERATQARADLDRLSQEGDGVISSAMAQAARRATNHFSGQDAVGAAADGGTDPAELWGRRIGRGLSLVAFFGLLIYLWHTYVR
jgi:hypothetical protein